MITVQTYRSQLRNGINLRGRQYHIYRLLLPSTVSLLPCRIQARRANKKTDIKVPDHSSQNQAQFHPSEILANTIASSEREGMKSLQVVVGKLRWR